MRLSTQEKLNRLVDSLLRGENIAGIKTSIDRNLRQYNFSCQSSIDAGIDYKYVISEAYRRTSKSISANPDRINDLPNWIKKVALNIIREESRTQQRTISFDEKQNILDDELPSLIEGLADNSNANREVLLKLELDIILAEGPLSEEIIWIAWHYTNGYRWQEIAMLYMERNPEKRIEESTAKVSARLRKKFNRFVEDRRKLHGSG
jgi:hypothetical protein